jgi:hypothetical protein
MGHDPTATSAVPSLRYGTDIEMRPWRKNYATCLRKHTTYAASTRITKPSLAHYIVYSVCNGTRDLPAGTTSDCPRAVTGAQMDTPLPLTQRQAILHALMRLTPTASMTGSGPGLRVRRPTPGPDGDSLTTKPNPMLGKPQRKLAKTQHIRQQYNKTTRSAGATFSARHRNLMQELTTTSLDDLLG